MAWLGVPKDDKLETLPQLTSEQLRRRRNRSIAIAVALGALVLIMVAITLVKGPGVAIRPL